jgi:hypothetical protein
MVFPIFRKYGETSDDTQLVVFHFRKHIAYFMVEQAIYIQSYEREAPIAHRVAFRT